MGYSFINVMKTKPSKFSLILKLVLGSTLLLCSSPFSYPLSVLIFLF